MQRDRGLRATSSGTRKRFGACFTWAGRPGERLERERADVTFISNGALWQLREKMTDFGGRMVVRAKSGLVRFAGEQIKILEKK